MLCSDKLFCSKILVNQVHDIVYWIDMNLNVVFINDAIKQFGYEPDDLINKPISLFLIEESYKKIVELHEEFQKDGSSDDVVKFDNKGVTHGGETYYTEIQAKPVFNDLIQIGWACVSRDITQRKINDQLKIENTKMHTMVEVCGGICHEFSQPLQVVTGNIMLLEMDGQVSKSTLETLKTSVQKINNLIFKLRKNKEYRTNPYLDRRVIKID